MAVVLCVVLKRCLFLAIYAAGRMFIRNTPYALFWTSKG